MKKLMMVVAIMVMITLISGTEALAQGGMMWKGGGGWGPAMSYGRMYNPQTFETISGEVVSMQVVSLFGADGGAGRKAIVGAVAQWVSGGKK